MAEIESYHKVHPIEHIFYKNRYKASGGCKQLISDISRSQIIASEYSRCGRIRVTNSTKRYEYNVVLTCEANISEVIDFLLKAENNTMVIDPCKKRMYKKVNNRMFVKDYLSNTKFELDTRDINYTA